VPQIDFHRALTLIGEHHALQRGLGLVFDIFVPLPGRTTVAPHAVFVTVTPSNFTPAGVTNKPPPVTPRTRANLSDTVFETQSATSTIVSGHLHLSDTNTFLVHEVDVDGGGLKTAQFADNYLMSSIPQPGSGQAAPDAPTSFAPPALRSAGITVSQVNRGLTFVGKLDRSAQLMGGVATNTIDDLTAEDLVRGYVLDVYDDQGDAWNSTAMRTGSYVASGVTVATPDGDEASLDAPPRMPGDAADIGPQPVPTADDRAHADAGHPAAAALWHRLLAAHARRRRGGKRHAVRRRSSAA
jgi:hypothetical protein